MCTVYYQVKQYSWSDKFDDDDLLAYAEQQMEEESKEAAPAEEESDEEDPLDAFMAGIEVKLSLIWHSHFPVTIFIYDRLTKIMKMDRNPLN